MRTERANRSVSCLLGSRKLQLSTQLPVSLTMKPIGKSNTVRAPRTMVHGCTLEAICPRKILKSFDGPEDNCEQARIAARLPSCLLVQAIFLALAGTFLLDCIS